MNTTSSSLLKIAAFAAFGTVAAHAVTINFSGATDFSGNFTSSGAGGRNAAEGVSGTAGGSIFNSNRAIYTGATDQIPALAAADSVTLSSYFKVTSISFGSGGARVFALGLSTDSAALASSAGGLGQAIAGEANFGFIVVSSAANSGNLNIRTFDSFNNVAPTTSANFGSVFAVTLNNWYKFDVIFTKSATAGSWSSTATISDYGATGASLVSVVKTASSTVSGVGASAVYNDASIYAGLSGASAFANRFDNFSLTTVSAVPEPSSAVALAGLGTLAFVSARRRRPSR